MKPLQLILLSVLLCFGGVLNAQDGPVDFGTQYLNGKTFFREGKYALAKEALKPVISKDYNNPFSAYASYYYALSAYRLGEVNMAKDMFLQILQFYPKWNNKQELYYWLGDVYCQLGEYALGFSYFDKVQESKIKKDVVSAKEHFVQQMQMEDMLLLYNDYPEDPSLSLGLANKINALPLSLQDRDLLMELIQKLGLNPEEYNVVTKNKSVKKDTYNIALLLPLFENEMKISHSKMSNQWVKDIYLGMSAAADSLNSEGHFINLVVYDTKRDNGQTAMLLESEELNNVDLILGPLYNGPFALANDFSFKNKINILHPLSRFSELIENNPYAYLYHSSYEDQGRKVADLIDTVAFSGAKEVLVISSKEAKDTLKVNAFMQLASEKNITVVHSLKVHKDSTDQVTHYLNKLNSGDEEDFTFAKDSVDFIYVASDKRNIAAKVISSLQHRRDSLKLIGDPKWLEYQSFDYNVAERMKICFIGDNYISFNSPLYRSLTNAYAHQFRTKPNSYYYSSFDLFYYIGTSLKEHGVYFQTEWREQQNVTPGVLSSGFYYGDKNSNQYMPVFRLNDGILENIETENNEH